MPQVEFTQYLRPLGTPRPIFIEMPEVVAQKALAMRNLNFRLEAEVLSNGMVAFTVADKGIEEDVVIKLVPNGPEVPPVVEAMIADFSITEALAYREKRIIEDAQSEDEE